MHARAAWRSAIVEAGLEYSRYEKEYWERLFDARGKVIQKPGRWRRRLSKRERICGSGWVRRGIWEFKRELSRGRRVRRGKR